AVRADAPAAPRQRTQRRRRTRDFEQLVDTFRQARAELPADEFKQLDIHISGLGRIALRAYFQHIGYATPGSAGKVFYGGADLLPKRYGSPNRPQGFRFKFRDRIDGKPVFLYVAPETLQAYPHRRYLEDILGCAETVRYFTLYALGRLVEAPSGKSYSLEPDALRHLAIIPGPAKDDASQSSS
ncbi:hypothetical protein HKW90_34780, partial [Pseudomonas aeruginosa]|nr:hypothetical protein [Pseudomonas aeruginosa]